jgi:hypothetical protein
LNYVKTKIEERENRRENVDETALKNDERFQEWSQRFQNRIKKVDEKTLERYNKDVNQIKIIDEYVANKKYRDRNDKEILSDLYKKFQEDNIEKLKAEIEQSKTLANESTKEQIKVNQSTRGDIFTEEDKKELYNFFVKEGKEVEEEGESFWDMFQQVLEKYLAAFEHF